MKTTDFDYHLPPEFIAQTPVEPRHASRLMVLDKRTGEVTHAKFWDLGCFLNPGDLLVLNQTRVIPARLYAHKIPSGGRVELLLLHKVAEQVWEVQVGGRGLTRGKRLEVEKGPEAEIILQLEGAIRHVRFDEAIETYLEEAGHVPLPPYIHTPLEDPERYQTMFARISGSSAAPTAGLHFTPELMSHLTAQGLRHTLVTLHVGLDTFAPVTEVRPEAHKIHTEWGEVTPESAHQINRSHHAGGRMVAVGTTSVRVLEAAAGRATKGELVGAFEAPTDLFILPGYTFRVVDALITNFHLPRSTLIMLVSAFAGREHVLRAYEEAKQAGYRFYSFGDAMLIL
ncbi:MAG: tRNA preQ1(34) S-adenosylmethionine ribosyltransferase-isomerase QueA [Chloroflexota bacterium]